MINELKSCNCKLELSLFHNIICEWVNDSYDKELFKSLSAKKGFMARRLNDLAREVFGDDVSVMAAAISNPDIEITLSNMDYIHICKVTYKDMIFRYYSHNNIYKIHFFNNTHCISNYKPKYSYKFEITPKNIVKEVL